MNAVAAIVLAAGGSTRMGRPKQLAQFRGRSLIRRACEAALEAGASPVIAVLGAAADECEAELDRLPVTAVRNAQWQSGMASSIAAGLETITHSSDRADAVVICLCDQPHVTSDTLATLIREHASSGARIVASEYQGVLGAPALFHSDFFDELRALRGDEGARKLFRAFPQSVARVPQPAAAFDVDTPADYQRLVQEAELSTAEARD